MNPILAFSSLRLPQQIRTLWKQGAVRISPIPCLFILCTIFLSLPVHSAFGRSDGFMDRDGDSIEDAYGLPQIKRTES
jgi:hypothetical protein